MKTITKEMVKNAYNQNLIWLDADPNTGSGTVARFGKTWLVFGGKPACELSPATYISSVPEEEIINEMFESIDELKTEMPEEYEYWANGLSAAKKLCSVSAKNLYRVEKTPRLYVNVRAGSEEEALKIAKTLGDDSYVKTYEDYDDPYRIYKKETDFKEGDRVMITCDPYLKKELRGAIGTVWKVKTSENEDSKDVFIIFDKEALNLKGFSDVCFSTSFVVRQGSEGVPLKKKPRLTISLAEQSEDDEGLSLVLSIGKYYKCTVKRIGGADLQIVPCPNGFELYKRWCGGKHTPARKLTKDESAQILAWAKKYFNRKDMFCYGKAGK